jgi:tetratricopeptide (TPR) repeat protein
MSHTAEQAPGKRDARREQLRFIGATAPLLRRLRRLIVALALLAPAQTAAADGRVLVVPFDNRQHEPTVYWLSEASAVLLADGLQARGVAAITRIERVRAFERLHLPLSASLSRATLIKVGELVGASEVIVGTYSLDGDTLKVNAHRIRIDVGRLQPDVLEQAPLTGLFPMFDTLAGRLAPETRAPSGARPPRPPLGAFENYIKGLIAESPAAQATFLETAVRLFAGYDRAELALWEVRTEQGDHAAALAAARAVKPGSALTSRARFLSGVSLINLKRYDEAFDLFKALVDIAPVPPLGTVLKPGGAAYNNLGVVVIRRGATPQTGTATFYLTKAADADPGDSDYLFNLGYAYVLERNDQGAVYWLREAVRRDPADADAHYVLAAALQAAGSTVEADREKELARQLSSRYEELEKRAAADRLPVPRGLERIRTEPEPSTETRPEQAIVNTAQREQRELAAFHLDRGRRLYEREEDREALVELRRAVYLSPYEAQAHLLIGRILLRAGRPKEAVDALKISIWSADSAPARIALGETYLKLENAAAARTELERALVLDPASSEAKRILSTIR